MKKDSLDVEEAEDGDEVSELISDWGLKAGINFWLGLPGLLCLVFICVFNLFMNKQNSCLIQL